jgi:hypothetical protein
VTRGSLDTVRKLTVRAAVCGQYEQRVVAEASAPARLSGETAVHGSFDYELSPSVDGHHGTVVMGGAPFLGNIFEFLEEMLVVRFITPEKSDRILRSEALAPYAGRPAECVHHQTGIVGHRGHTRAKPEIASFGTRVLHERRESLEVLFLWLRLDPELAEADEIHRSLAKKFANL